MENGAIRVLVTGANGFIGRHAVQALTGLGLEVVTTGRASPVDRLTPRFVPSNILEPGGPEGLIRTVRPTHLLHLAWDVSPGQYWQAPGNLDWVAASLRLARAFAGAGGRRFVASGTCAEYRWDEPCLDEFNGRIAPETLYGKSKAALGSLLIAGAPALGISAAWGRTFWLYGPGENPGRLVSDVANLLLAGVRADCTSGTQRRDYLHVADVAGAFVAALLNDYEGVFNVGSGTATRVGDIVSILAEELGRPELLHLGAKPDRPGEPECVVANVDILSQRIGFKPRYDLRSGLADTAQWWRTTTR